MPRPRLHDEDWKQIRPRVSPRAAELLAAEKAETGASLSFLVNRAVLKDLEPAAAPSAETEPTWDLGGGGERGPS